MLVCCRYNASERCRNCSCIKSGRPCIDCLPNHHGRCQNSSTSPLTFSPRPRLPGRCTSVKQPLCQYTMTVPLPTPPHHKVPSMELVIGISDLHRCVDDYPLPPFSHVHEPTFTWGNQDGSSFADSVTCCYAEVVHWKRDLFKVPPGTLERLLKSHGLFHW